MTLCCIFCHFRQSVHAACAAQLAGCAILRPLPPLVRPVRPQPSAVHGCVRRLCAFPSAASISKSGRRYDASRRDLTATTVRGSFPAAVLYILQKAHWLILFWKPLWRLRPLDLPRQYILAGWKRGTSCAEKAERSNALLHIFSFLFRELKNTAFENKHKVSEK